jgi:hypothetical protein
MERQTNTATLPDHPAFIPPVARHPIARFFIGLFAVLVIAAASYAIYAFEHKRVTNLKAEQTSLQAQITSLQHQITAVKTASEASK